jgi:hypothetical protein
MVPRVRYLQNNGLSFTILRTLRIKNDSTLILKGCKKSYRIALKYSDLTGAAELSFHGVSCRKYVANCHCHCSVVVGM